MNFQAAAFSGVSIYVHWGLVEGKPGNLDWNHFRSIEEFYKIAQRVGLFVVVRPGVNVLDCSGSQGY